MAYIYDNPQTYTGDPACFTNSTGKMLFNSIDIPISLAQDLHEYSSPWAAGAGRNKMPYPWFKNQGSITPNDLTITFNSDGSMSMAGTASANTWVYQNAYDAQGTYNFEFPAGDYIMSAEGVTGGSASGYRFQMSVYSKNPYSLLRTYYVYNGETINVHINAGECEACYLYVPSGKNCDGITYKPMLRLSTDADATYEPYENDCPINGLTSLSAYRSGKNLFGFSTAFASGAGTAISKAQKTGTINVKNTSSTRYCGFGVWYNGILSMKPFPVGKYTISFDVSGDWGGVNFAFGVRSVASNTFVNSETVYFSAAGHYTMTFDSSAWTQDYYLSASRVGNSTADVDVTFYNLQIEVGETASAFEQYVKNTYSVNWYTQAGTVYGGTLDAVSGVLTVDRILFATTWAAGSQEEYLTNCIKKSFSFSVADDKSKRTGALCSIASYITEDTLAEWDKGSVFSIDGSNNYIYLSLPNSTDGTTSIQFCYYLETPVTYQLSPFGISILTGVNAIWASNSANVSATVSDILYNFQGWLLKVGANMTLVPTTMIKAESYKVTPNQRMEETAERDSTGVLWRETVSNMPPKIEFNTPAASDTDVNNLNTIFRNAYSNEQERKLTVAFYDPEENVYKTWECYMPNIDFPIRTIDIDAKTILYDEIRYAFIGY